MLLSEIVIAFPSILSENSANESLSRRAGDFARRFANGRSNARKSSRDIFRVPVSMNTSSITFEFPPFVYDIFALWLGVLRYWLITIYIRVGVTGRDGFQWNFTCNPADCLVSDFNLYYYYRLLFIC